MYVKNCGKCIFDGLDDIYMLTMLETTWQWKGRILQNGKDSFFNNDVINYWSTPCSESLSLFFGTHLLILAKSNRNHLQSQKKIYPPSPSSNSKQTEPWYRTFVNKMKTAEKELQSNMVAEGWDIIPTIRANSPYSIVTTLSIYNVDDTNTKICTKNNKNKSIYPIFFGCRYLKLVCL